MSERKRPTSPHITIYKNPITSYLSMGHRVAGVFLSVGMLLLIYWLVALAGGKESFATAQAIFGSFIGQLIMFGFSFAFFYYFCTAVRHIVWDFGYGFEMKTAEKTGIIALGASIVMTILFWIILLSV